MTTIVKQVKVTLPRITEDAGWCRGKLWKVTGSAFGEPPVTKWYLKHPYGEK